MCVPSVIILLVARRNMYGVILFIVPPESHAYLGSITLLTYPKYIINNRKVIRDDEAY